MPREIGAFLFYQSFKPAKLYPMKTVYLIRHGKAENPTGVFYPPETPLSQQGVHQAQAIAQDILKANCHPIRIVCSPYLRTRETAEIIAQTLNNNALETDEHLIEWQVGGWFGKPLNAFRTAAGYDQEPFHLQLTDVEPFEKMSTRIIATIQDTLSKIPENSCAIIVSHREPMVSAILALQRKPNWEDIPKLDFLPGSGWRLDFKGTELISAIKAFDRSNVT